MSAISNFSYVTLVAQGGVPVRLADQFGANLPTTGNGSLVFSNGAVLTNATITGTVNTFPLGAPNGTVAAPSIYFGTPDRGLYSRGSGDVSVAANGALMLSSTTNALQAFFAANSLQMKLFSDTAGEVVIQGYDTAGTNTKQLTLNKYGANVAIGAANAPSAGGASTFGGLLLTSNSVSLTTGTGAPTLTAPTGSLYMRHDGTALPYFNTDGATTWQQLVGLTATQTLTNKTLTSPAINTPTITGGTITGATISGGSITFGAINGTSASANALSTGLTGTTNPTFNVDNSTALAVSGINIKGAVTGGTVAITATDPNAAVNLSLNAKGTGTIAIGSVSTGRVTITPVTTITGSLTLSAALNYGGVTLSNGVTGTGNMVLDTAPTLSNPVVGTQTANDNSTKASSTAYADRVLKNMTIAVQVITSSGTYTPNANMVYCQIECWGAGGGGGGSANSGGSVSSSGSGGGAGSYSRKVVSKATIGASQVATIGAAGGAGASGNNPGGTGGDTSIGVICVGKGGIGGLGSDGTTSKLLGGLGGAAGTGDITTTGMPGGPGGVSISGSFVGNWVPNGGSSLVGGGGRYVTSGTLVNGEAGTGHGSGGAGGCTWSTSGAVAGGAGTTGYIVITEWCSQ